MRVNGWIVSSLGAAALMVSPMASAQAAETLRAPVGMVRPSDERVDLKALTRRAHAGNAHAQYALALVYEEGRGGIKKDLAYALSWYEEAARNGLKIAVEKLHSITGEN